MGLDFMEKVHKTVRKRWDRAAVELGTPDLLKITPNRAGCSAVFEMVASARLLEGGHVTIESDGSILIARRGLSVIASAANPPPQVLQAVKDSYGVAKGTVEHVHDVANVVEILLC